MDVIYMPKGYNLFKQLGKGTFGVVFLTVGESNPDLFATKVINLSKVKNRKTLEYLKKEKEIMEELKHINIIRLDRFIKSKKYYFFIMEYCNGGSLYDLLKKYKEKYRKPFTLEIIQYFMRQIVEGLKYIHSKNIIHRDLKLPNILINFNNVSRKTRLDAVDYNELDNNDLLHSTIKIIDFGLSKKLRPNELAMSLVGTPFNMDPFILKKYQQAGGYERVEGYNEKADIWSLGTICYQMLTGDPLFAADTLNDLITKVENGNYSIPINIEISNEINSFLNSMLQYDGDLRPSAEELSHHDFLIKNVKDFTKIDYRKNPKAKDISYIIINAMRNSIVINEPKKTENYKELYLNYINNLKNDYIEVKKYFKENGFPKRENDANQKCLQIENIKKKLISGTKIYLDNLPNKISPEYIYGCSTEERKKIFREILSRNRAEKNLLEVKLKFFENKEIKNKNDIDENEKNKEKYNKLTKIIKELEEQSKNVWVPPPKYIKETQKVPKEIISYVKSVFQIKVTIKRIDNIFDSLDLKITLVVNQTKELEKKLELKSQNSFDEWIWTLNSDDWMNIDNNISNFILIIKINKFFNKNPEIHCDISKIKSGKGINFDQQIIDNNIAKKINISIIPILPEGEKIITYEEKEIISVQKLYPPFEIKSKNDNKLVEKPPLISFSTKHSRSKF